MHFLIIRDYKENRRKCTLTPLEGRPEVAFTRPPRRARGQPACAEVDGGLLLALGGPILSPADRELLGAGAGGLERPLVVVDSSWARLPAVMRCLRVRGGGALQRRTLPPQVVTAYPRASKLHADPPGGLASVEAIFMATVVLGEPQPDLLRGYRWADEFCRRNRQVLQQFGWAPAGERLLWISRAVVGTV